MRKTLLMSSLFMVLTGVCWAQDYEFKALKQTQIKGAPRLTAPKLLKAGDEYVMAEKFGHAAPGLYDWNKDGKLDLLVGEFGGGKAANLKVYLNTGKKNKPEYSSTPFYAKDKTGELMYISGS